MRQWSVLNKGWMHLWEWKPKFNT